MQVMQLRPCGGVDSMHCHTYLLCRLCVFARGQHRRGVHAAASAVVGQAGRLALSTPARLAAAGKINLLWVLCGDHNVSSPFGLEPARLCINLHSKYKLLYYNQIFETTCSTGATSVHANCKQLQHAVG